MNPLDALSLARHGCLRFSPHLGPVVYIDPFQLTGSPMDADIIVVTHEHSDHYSPSDIRRVMNGSTLFCANQSVLDKLAADLNIPARRLLLLRQEEELAVGTTRFLALPAENKNHPLGFGYGVLMTLMGIRYYIAGDTDVLADVPCDVMFVPCDGIYNMPEYENRVPALLASMANRPGLVVPYHYAGYIEGTDMNGLRLYKALKAAGFNSALVISG